MSSADVLYSPTDVAEAKQAWGANSGPAALAAILRRPVMTTIGYFPRFVSNRCVYPAHMRDAILVATKNEPDVTRFNAGSMGRVFPGRGVACVQFHGPWDRKRSKGRGAAQLKHAHWIATFATVDGMMIYDASVQQWLHMNDWLEDVLPPLMEDHKSGGWWCRMGYEVLS